LTITAAAPSPPFPRIAPRYPFHRACIDIAERFADVTSMPGYIDRT
jgi:hypothetical protein